MKFKDMISEVISKPAYAMARTISADPLQSFNFRVSIPGLPSSVGFQSVSGISKEVEVIEYFESMYEHVHKLPGRETIGEITMTRGAYADAYLQTQYEKIFNNNNVRQTVVIQILDRFYNVRRTFKFAECWFSAYELGDLDSTTSEALIETLTLQAEYMLA